MTWLDRGFRAPPWSPELCPRPRRDRACAAPRRERAAQPILQPPPRFPSRARGAASARRRGTSPAGWPRLAPAMSGAEPCTGSNSPGACAPSEALGSMPIEPVSIAASSERMSPNMFSVRSRRSAAAPRRAASRRCPRARARAGGAGTRARGPPRPPPATAARSRARSPCRRSSLSPRRAERGARDPLDLPARVGAHVARGLRGARLSPK